MRNYAPGTTAWLWPLSPDGCHGTAMVKGSHGLVTALAEDGPLVISNAPDLLPDGAVDATAFKNLVLAHVLASR